jgi:hypothetical protein
MYLHKPTFTTKRLNVFVFLLQISDESPEPRRFYVGFLKQEYTAHIVTATVSEGSTDSRPYLDMIETHDTMQRKGYATELVNAIELDLGRRVDMDGYTHSGEKFCAAYQDARR